LAVAVLSTVRDQPRGDMRQGGAPYDGSTQGWVVNPGQFDLLVGGSSQDLPLKQTVEVRATQPAYPQLTRISLLKEFKRHPKGKAFYPQLAEAFGLGNPDESTEMTPNLTPSVQMNFGRFAPMHMTSPSLKIGSAAGRAKTKSPLDDAFEIAQ
jgi:hypothetical protein